MARVIQPTADGGSDAFWSTTQLAEFIGDRKDGYLFCTDSGKPLSPRNILRDSLHPTLAKLKQTKMGFHCFRRFRESVLQKSEARGLLVAALRWTSLDKSRRSSWHFAQQSSPLAVVTAPRISRETD